MVQKKINHTSQGFMKLVELELQKKRLMTNIKKAFPITKDDTTQIPINTTKESKRNYLTITYTHKKNITFGKFDTQLAWVTNYTFNIPENLGIKKAKTTEDYSNMKGFGIPLALKDEEGYKYNIEGKLSGSLGIYRVPIITEDTKRGYLVNCGFTTTNFSTVTGLFPAGYIIAKDFYEKQVKIQKDTTIDDAIKGMIKYAKKFKDFK
jgi:hypothetical protein